MRRVGLIGFCALTCTALVTTPAAQTSMVGRVQTLAPDVYFYEGDISKGHCNNGWVVFEDYVLVIDANYPSGAREVIAKIRELTKKPIRFAFDTHHHGDHAYGNQVWVDEGATPVAHTGVLDEMKRLETGLFGDKPGRWEGEAKGREDLRGSKLKPPSLLFPDTLIFDDGKHRVELRHFGTAHTKGDGVAWLPKEKIVFTGDMAVNGPFNFVGDGHVASWIKTLSGVAGLGASTVGPGHGPLGDASVLRDQSTFFQELSAAVTGASKGGTPETVQAAIPTMRAQVLKNSQVTRYVGDGFPAQVAKVYNELTGLTLPDRRAEVQAERTHVAWHHGHAHGAPQRRN
jgi:glyoxylase-like metal-dependent hydrolase (beta-lactamase superfamily II)